MVLLSSLLVKINVYKSFSSSFNLPVYFFASSSVMISGTVNSSLVFLHICALFSTFTVENCASVKIDNSFCSLTFDSSSATAKPGIVNQLNELITTARIISNAITPFYFYHMIPPDYY